MKKGNKEPWKLREKKAKKEKKARVKLKELLKEQWKDKRRWLAVEKNLVHFFSKRRVKGLTALMKFMTRVGDGWLWFAMCILFLAVNLYAGLAMSFASLIQIILQQIVKHIFGRNRPYVSHEEISIVVTPPDRFSFPSGHTAGAFVMVFIFYFFYPVLFIPMLVLAALIAFSRIYLGLHYLTDVLAGVLLGFISARLGIWLAIDILPHVLPL